MSEIVTYDEYIKKVPKRTGMFVKDLLEFFYYGDSTTRIGDIHFDNNDGYRGYGIAKLYSLLPEGSKVMSINGLEFTKYINYNDSITLLDRRELFIKYIKFLTPTSHEGNYDKLTPSDIVLNLFNGNIISNSDFTRIFGVSSRNAVSLKKDLQKLSGIIKKDEYKELFNDISLGLSMKVRKYLLSCIESFKSKSFSEKTDVGLHALLTLFNYDNNLSKKIFEFHGIDLSTMEKEFGVEEKSDSQDDLEAFKSVFKNLIDKGYNTDKKKKELTIDNIVANLFNEDIYYSDSLDKFINDYSINSSVFKDLDEDKLNVYISLKYNEEVKNIKDTLPDFIYNYLCSLHGIAKAINKNVINDDLRAYSDFLSIIKNDSEVNSLLEEKEITFEYVCKLLNVDSKEIKNEFDLSLYRDEFANEESYISFLEESEFVDLENYLKYISNSIDWDALNPLISKMGISVDTLKEIVLNKQQVYTSEERFEQLKNKAPQELEVVDEKALRNFSRDLAVHPRFISKADSSSSDIKIKAYENSTKLQELIEGAMKKTDNNSGLFQRFRKNKEPEYKIDIRNIDIESFSEDLYNFCVSQEKLLQESLSNQEFVKQYSGYYVLRLKQERVILENAKAKLEELISKNLELNNELKNIDLKHNLRTVEEKLIVNTQSIITHTNIYTQAKLTYYEIDSSLLKLEESKKTTIPELIFYLTSREGVEASKQTKKVLALADSFAKNILENNQKDLPSFSKLDDSKFTPSEVAKVDVLSENIIADLGLETEYQSTVKSLQK